MIPAKYGQVTFIFFVSICMSCVVSGVSVLNTAGFVEAFFGLWMTAWFQKLGHCFSQPFDYRTIGATFCR